MSKDQETQDEFTELDAELAEILDQSSIKLEAELWETLLNTIVGERDEVAESDAMTDAVIADLREEREEAMGKLLHLINQLEEYSSQDSKILWKKIDNCCYSISEIDARIQAAQLENASCHVFMSCRTQIMLSLFKENKKILE